MKLTVPFCRLLACEEFREMKEQKRQATNNAQEEILQALATLPRDAVLRHAASNASLCAAALRKHGNVLPESFIAELNRLLEKRRRAPSVYDFSKNSNTPFDDIARWATTGAIASTGFQKTANGEKWLLDPDNLPDEAKIQSLYAAEAHLPMSQRVFGNWTQASIIARDWTKREVDTVLGEPDKTMPNPHHKTGKHQMRLYLKKRVLIAEERGAAPQKKSH